MSTEAGKSQHTPGPWELSPSGFRVVWAERNSIGELTSSGLICDTANNRNTRTPENAANARLIAAAPEMAECLARILEELPTKRDWLDPELERRSRDALKKAGIL